MIRLQAFASSMLPRRRSSRVREKASQYKSRSCHLSRGDERVGAAWDSGTRGSLHALHSPHSHVRVDGRDILSWLPFFHVMMYDKGGKPGFRYCSAALNMQGICISAVPHSPQSAAASPPAVAFTSLYPPTRKKRSFCAESTVSYIVLLAF